MNHAVHETILTSAVRSEGVARGLRRRVVPWSEIRSIDVRDCTGLRVHLSDGRTFRVELPHPDPRGVIARLRSCAPAEMPIALSPPEALEQTRPALAVPVLFGAAGVLVAAYVAYREPWIFVGAPAGLLAMAYFVLRWRSLLRRGKSRVAFGYTLVIGLLMIMPAIIIVGRTGPESGFVKALARMSGCLSAFFLVAVPLSYPIRAWLCPLWRRARQAEGLLTPGAASCRRAGQPG